MIQEEGLTYDDVLLIPQKSLESRTQADTKQMLYDINLKVPVLSANMSSVTGYEMAAEMNKWGGLGVIHRKMPSEDRKYLALQLLLNNIPAYSSIGVKDSIDKIRRLSEHTTRLCLDVANAYNDKVARKIEQIKSEVGWPTLMVGNVATVEGAKFLESAGADIVKVGIGPGSVCTTRLITGHGYPQFSAVYNISRAVKIPVVADGGIKEIGDIAKALGAGATAVMSGYLFAGCEESEGRVLDNGRKEYYGMASSRGIVNGARLEGIVGSVPKAGNVYQVMTKIRAGLQSAMSYSGSRNLTQFRRNAKFVKVTPHTLRENYTRV